LLDKQPQRFKVIKHFTPATNSTSELIKTISESITSLFQTGIQYYRVDLSLLDLSSDPRQKFELFIEHENDAAFMKLLDDIKINTVQTPHHRQPRHKAR